MGYYNRRDWKRRYKARNVCCVRGYSACNNTISAVSKSDSMDSDNERHGSNRHLQQAVQSGRCPPAPAG